MSAVLAVDAGQTAMKVRVRSADGVFEERLPGIRTDEPLLPQLADVARTALALSGVAADVLTAGVSGLTAKDADASALAALLDGTPLRRVVLAHDSTTSFLGALGTARGVVVAAGTGVVTLGVGRERIARVDGWGHTMGDAGSGFWIGREALAAVMRAHDGRGPQTTLTDAVRAVWPSLPDAYIELQSDPDWVRRVAAFAAAVADLTTAGDAVAAGITDRAAHELAHSAITALTRVDESDDPDARVCIVGGVFRSESLRSAFTATLRDAGVAARLEPSHGEGIDGAMALATLSADHPFATHTSVYG
ncbi:MULTISPECIES: BadF/BadG/BcrA/BcrD ATPase family protein [Microbacterium]|uniref:BadF-type ATPase n=1 Tax=Microbacterium saccharophilum TaxID=1213358 RepID=A0A7Z7GEN9_9MICO|nr:MULTISPECIES: BadF/BadG/BcrA/BcrD ATPase family protein [Microbacterium]SFI66359.1 BadF-type ATPase [Microbacterium saccharophilum]